MTDPRVDDIPLAASVSPDTLCAIAEIMMERKRQGEVAEEPYGEWTNTPREVLISIAVSIVRALEVGDHD